MKFESGQSPSKERNHGDFVKSSKKFHPLLNGKSYGRTIVSLGLLTGKFGDEARITWAYYLYTVLLPFYEL